MLLLVLLPLLVGFSDGCNRVPKTVTLEDNTQIQLMDPSFLTIPKLVLEEGVDAIRDGVEYPPFFDLSQAYPECNIRRVFYQGPCGSCWAVATATALSDAVCVQTGRPFEYSPADALDCCGDYCGDYHGGSPFNAFKYFVKNGSISGGYNGRSDGCYPYWNSYGYADSCPAAPVCHRTDNGCTPSYLPKAVKASEGMQGIQQLLYDYKAPVVVAIHTNSDIYNYKGGIVSEVDPGKKAPDHAVKVIGWGQDMENKYEDYWIIVNSWGSSWGTNGTMLLRRGRNDFNLELGMGGATVVF